ncbi:MAG: response regulator [Planctomycetes bacterium]|nr:response regulator [Planctomycetota bacterium]MCW8136962.1 response regulator [Planctomycetota bacterium]
MDDTRARQSIVLIVGEDSGARCQSLVESLGATCYRAFSMAEATASLAHHAPDVVVADYDLPDGNGIELITSLRQTKEHRSTPVILLTGEIHPAQLERAVMAGLYAFLAKPFNSQEFVKLVNAAISESADRVRGSNG